MRRDRIVPMRTCYKCGVARPLDMFYIALEERRAAKDGRSSWRMHCRHCQREKNNARKLDRKAYTDALKVAAGCVDCGLVLPDNPEVYDFDHIRGGKVLGVAERLMSGTWDDFLAEIARCEVVCSNCHRIRTRNRPSTTFGKSR